MSENPSIMQAARESVTIARRYDDHGRLSGNSEIQGSPAHQPANSRKHTQRAGYRQRGFSTCTGMAYTVTPVLPQPTRRLSAGMK